jgi:DNA repair exonuclease SbcCD ATPase subunit
LGITLANISKFLESLPEINELPENHVFRSIKKDLLKKEAKIEDQLGLHNRFTETLSSIQGWKSQIENIDTSNPIQGWVNSNTLGLKNLSLLQGKVERELRELQRDGAVLQTTKEQIQQIRIHLESLTEFIESEKQIKEEIQSVSVQLAALNSRGLGEIQHSELDTLEQKLSQISSSTQLQTHQVEVEKLKEQINTTQQNLSLELSKQIEEKTQFFNKFIKIPTDRPAQSFTNLAEAEKHIKNLENQMRNLESSTILSEEHIALKEQVNKLIPLYLEELRNVVTLLKNAEVVHAQVNQLSEQPLSESSTVSLESNIQKLQTKQTQLKKQVEFLGNNSNAGLALQTVISSIEERLNNLDTEIQTRYELGNSLKELIKTPTNKPAQSFKTSSEIEKHIENLENQLKGLVESSTVYEEHVVLKQKATMEVVPQYLEKLKDVATQLKNVELIQSKLNEVNKKTVLEQITESPKGSIEELQAWQTQLEEELQSLNKNSNAFSVVQNVLKEVKQRLSKIENALEFFKSLDLPLGDKILAKEIQAAEESLQRIKINFKKQETG